MSAHNILVIMMDELSRDGVGCYGGTGITPHLDALAARGTRFTRAYTPSPICVPARAAFQSGQYVYQNRCWSNAQPYTGAQRGWAHELSAQGIEATSIGKLHYRSTDDDNGYVEEHHPLHVKDGEGWVFGLLRRQDHTVFDTSGFASDRGPGEDGYSDYDRRVRDGAVEWLRSRGQQPESDRPWMLFVSFLRPHYPLTCPEPFYNLYDPEQLPLPRFSGRAIEFRHPVLNAFRQYNDFDDYFPDDHARQVARASYFGLCSFADALVGDVLGALNDAGLTDNTLVVATSDHGEMIGHHGLWTKMNMYEDSAGIPLIVSGPDIPVGECVTQASLIDIHPTVLAGTGARFDADDPDHPGLPLQELANQDDDEQRMVLSEFHDGGAITGIFMVREGRWKYVAYAGFAPQLFDLDDDPEERTDLGLSDAHQSIRGHMHARLCNEFGDPEAISEAAFADQAERIAELGGMDGIYRRNNYDHTPVE
jgi:choline-sulfatase